MENDRKGFIPLIQALQNFSPIDLLFSAASRRRLTFSIFQL